jgi:acetyl esterase/lipase
MSNYAESFAERGYVCISITYRLDGQQPLVGADFQPIEQSFAPFTPVADAIGAAVEDAVTAYRWLIDNAPDLGIDTGRIGVGGSSAGAITSLFAAYTLDDFSVANLPSFGAVFDLWGALYHHTDDLESDEPPVFLVHGEEDTVVPFSQAEDLLARVTDQAVTSEHYFRPGVGHGVNVFNTFPTPGVTIFDRMVLFAYEHLALDSIGELNEVGPHWSRYF